MLIVIYCIIINTVCILLISLMLKHYYTKIITTIKEQIRSVCKTETNNISDSIKEQANINTMFQSKIQELITLIQHK